MIRRETWCMWRARRTSEREKIILSRKYRSRMYFRQTNERAIENVKRSPRITDVNFFSTCELSFINNDARERDGCAYKAA